MKHILKVQRITKRIKKIIKKGVTIFLVEFIKAVAKGLYKGDLF